MEVFPPDDTQPNDVDSGPTIPHHEQMKDWDDSFASLEIALQAACETKDAHSDIDSSKESILPNISLNENQVKTDVKRKWDDEIVDVDSSQRKLKRMNNMLLGSGEVTIHLVGSTDNKCDNIPISNLLTIVKSETKPKSDELGYDIAPEKVPSQTKHSLEFKKIEPKKEIKDENSDFKNQTVEFKPEISSEVKIEQHFDNEKNFSMDKNFLTDDKKFSMDDKNFSTDVKDLSTDDKSFPIDDKTFSAPDKNFAADDKNFSADTEITVSKDIKSDSGFTDDLSTESKADFFSPDDDILSYDIKNSDELGDFKSDIDSECALSSNMSHAHSDNGTGLSSCPDIEDGGNHACDDSNMNDIEDSSEKKKEKEKKDELGEKSSKKDDKLSKKKKFERCNIRDIKLEDELDAVTLSAQKEEQERIRRLQEAQMRALQERLQQIEVEKEALTQLFSQSPDDAPNLFDSSMSESDTADNCKKSLVKSENDVVLLESSDEDKKADLQNIIPAPMEENIIDISSSSSGNESDSDDSDKKDDDVMVLSDEGETEGEGSAEDPNNSGAHTNDCFNLLDEEGRVLVNVGHPPEDPDIFLAPQIAKVIKPHQIGGIRFLYDNVVENLERYKSSSGFGCILAHSMGLGKTVQVVSFVDVFLRHTPATLVLCIVPINTIQNWKAEFDMWVPPTNCVEDAQVLSGEVRPRDYNVYTLNENFKTMAARAALIAEWRKQGGVLLMGYEMYRMLALRKMPKVPLKKSKRLKKQEAVEPETNEQIKKYMDEMYEHIVIPGPDLVICDEGHRIKNSLASTSMALKSIKTRRRVVLTGYPLQNNLLEYWCMVDFVRPNYLGSRAEFCNMFERPISNGQCIDSTPRDRQLMRFRSHVLHSLLVGFVQRRGHSVLRAVLPKKEEHVLLIRMTPIQRQLYKCFVKDLLYVQQATNPLKLFAVCCKIWNHPDILYKLLQEKKAQEDIDLDIDITIATNSGISGSGVKKRAINQAKSKLMQRSLRALPRNLKPQPGLINSSDDTIKSETNSDVGNIPATEETSFNSSVICKEEFPSNQTNVPDQKDYSQQGSQSYPSQYPAKNNLNQQLCQQNYPLNSGQYSASQTQVQYMSTNNSLISSQIQYPSQTSPQSGTQQQYAQSPLMQQQYGQTPNQYSQSNTQAFSQVNSQFGIQTNPQEETAAHPPPSPSSFQGKSSQSFTSQSNALQYSQRSEVQNQYQQNSSQTQFSKQPNSNQDVHFPHSQPSNKKFNSQSSQQYPQSSVPHQPYNSQTSSQQYSQPQSYPPSSKQHQYSEQQPALQFSSQLPENISVTHSTAQQSYSQLSNPQSHVSEQPGSHHFSSQSTFQRSPPHSQFSQAQSTQQFPQQTTSLPSQFSSQGSFPQISSEHFPPQSSSQQPSPTQTSFSQSSTSQVYTQLFSQQSSEFSQLSPSHQQFQQQNIQPFPSQQAPKPTFSQGQSFPESTQTYTEQTPSVQTQFSQAFPQSYLQSDQQYTDQSSPQQFSQQNVGQQNFSTQTFGHQSSQVSKYSNKQGQPSTFSPQPSSVTNLQFSQPSPQAAGQKQVSSSPPQEGTQQKFNQQTFSSQSSESQYSQQSGSSLSFCQQSSSQSNAQSFSQHGSQPAAQYSPQQITPASHQYIQISTASQFNQTASSTQTYNNQQASQQFSLSGNQSSQQYNQSQPSQQYGQQINPSSQYSQQAGSSSQQFPQQPTSTQQFSPQSTKAKQFSQSTQNHLFSQTKSSHFPQSSQNQKPYSQQISQAPQACSQQLVQNPLGQQSQFSQQQSQLPQQYSLQVPPSPQQYNQPSQSPQQFPQSSQSPQQFLQQPDQSPQQYAQQSTSSSIQSSQSSQHFVGTHSHQQFSQQTTQSSQEFGQPSIQSSESFNKQVGQVSQQYNQRKIQTPEQFNPLPGQSQQFNQGSQPQQFTPQANQTSQIYKHQVNANSQAYKQQIQSPQYNQISTQSQQQYSQKQLQNSQYSQQTSQQYSQQQCPSAPQFPQPPCQSPQQFTQPVQSQPAAPSPQQFTQQPAHSPQQYSQQPTQSPQQFAQQPSQSPQQFPQQTSQSPQQFSQTTSPHQFVQQPVQSPQQYPQQTNPSPQQFSQQPSPQQFTQPSQSQQPFSQQNAPSPQEFAQQPPQQVTQSAQQFSQLTTSQYKQQSLHSRQSPQFPLPKQCLANVPSQQFSNSFPQSTNQDNLKEAFQSEYQNQIQSNIAVMPQQGLSTQSINQQASKVAVRVAKTKQGRGKSLCQSLLPQSSVQHSQTSLKQPPSFSVQSFQNGGPSSPKRPVGQQAVKQLPNSSTTSFQPLNSSIVQDNFSIQHLKQDSGVFPSKCSKAVLQQGKSQVSPDTTSIQPLPHNPLKSDSAQMENDQPNVCTDTTLMPFRDRIDSSISYEWAIPIMKEYVLGVLENSHKMMVLFVIIAETLRMGDKLLVFSQSLSTLDLLEHFLGKIQVPKKPDQPDPMPNETWCRNKNYFRLDGSTSAQEREKLINEFNRNDNVSLFLLSTRAGCLGINLVGANRIVVMDASWNPCHDAQAVCRIYRYGQKKQCHIYRLVTDNSLEKRIYDRQVNKQGMSDRVVDELNPESNFTWKDVTTLIQDDEDDGPIQELSKFSSSYSDRVLKYLVSEMSPSLSKEPFEHESLLLDRKDLKLTKQEKRLAKQSYEMAKRANMINIRTTYTYLPAGTPGGGQIIINNKQCQWVGGTTIRVLPNQTATSGGNVRPGTTATPITASPSLMSSLFKQGVMVQKLTMPSNVSIPVLTPGAPPVVIPAGQDVLVLRTPKGVYLRLPDGRIIAVQLPPSLLAKTQFRPNVVTHFRPAAPKGGNQPSTVINTPRGQSIGIIKQTLQCGGTVRYLGPRSAAGSTAPNSARCSAPEVIDLSDDDEPSLRKSGTASNASTNSSESDTGSIDQDKLENMQPMKFPGKQITIRKVSPSSPQNSSISSSKDKCEIPQVLSKNKQITIMPINPTTQQNRQKFAPQLAQPVRVQQMLLQPQQGKRKLFQKNTSKVPMTPVLTGKNVRPQITITQPTSIHSSIQSQTLRQAVPHHQQKGGEFLENMCDSSINSPTKQTEDSSNISSDRGLSSNALQTQNVSQILQNSKNISISLSEPLKTSTLPDSLASLTNKLNPNLQISPVEQFPKSQTTLSSVGLKTPVSDIIPQKNIFHPNTSMQAVSSTSSLQTQIAHNTVQSSRPVCKSPQLSNKTDSTVQQLNVTQSMYGLKPTSQTNYPISQTTSLSSAASAHTPDQSFQHPMVSHSNIHQMQQKLHGEQQSLQYPSQTHSQNPRLTASSAHQSQSASRNQQVASRKRKSTNKLPSKKSQHEHSVMTQSHPLTPQAAETKTSQQFQHSQLSDHLPETHFSNFVHHISGSDFQAFSNFSPHKPMSHIQHPQPLHPLQHSQEHNLPPHLQHMSRIYPMPSHIPSGPSSLSDMQPPAPRAWPVPQPAVSSFHPFSQSSSFYSSGQESSQFSFQPSSFPLPPSSVASNTNQSESNISSGSGEDKTSQISSSDL